MIVLFYIFLFLLGFSTGIIWVAGFDTIEKLYNYFKSKLLPYGRRYKKDK